MSHQNLQEKKDLCVLGFLELDLLGGSLGGLIRQDCVQQGSQIAFRRFILQHNKL